MPEIVTPTPISRQAQITTDLDVNFALFDALVFAETNPELPPGYTIDSRGYVCEPPRSNRATRRAEAAQARRATPAKPDRNEEFRASGCYKLADLDADLGHNRRTGWCPTCGQPTHHIGFSGLQGCGLCNWIGRVPGYVRPEFMDRLERHFALGERHA